VQRGALCRLCSARWLAGHKKPKQELLEVVRNAPDESVLEKMLTPHEDAAVRKAAWQLDSRRGGAISTISLIEADTNPRTGVKRIHASQSRIGVRQAMTLHGAGSTPDAEAGRRPPLTPAPKPPPPTPQRMAAVGSAWTPPQAGGMATSMSMPIINGRGQVVSRPGSAAAVR